jgi:hypothetical protein
MFSAVNAQYIAPGYCDITPQWDNIHINNGPIPAGSAKIFFITNRPYIPDASNLEYFPNAIADYRKVSYLIVSCDGSNWQLTFVRDFNEGMKEINDGRDILLFIEGHGKKFPMLLNRAFQIQARYNLALVVFDWPSANNNFNKSLARVRRCSDNFYNLLLQIKDYRSISMKDVQHFSILAHSLGNYFISSLVVDGCNQYMKGKFIDNIVLNAAAIRSKEHGEVLSQLNFSKKLYITSNKNDFVLRGAHLLTSGKMLGNVIIKPYASNAQYVNFSGKAGKEHSYYFGYHSFEHENPAFFYFYNTVLHGNEVNLGDTNYFSPRPTGDGYDITNTVKK